MGASALFAATDAELAAEARTRGFVLLPAGAWEDVVGGLEARLAAAEGRLAAEAERQANLVDGTELFHELAEYASVHYPAAVAEIGELMTENSGLRQRADRLEHDFSTVAQALVCAEFPELYEDS